MRQKIIPPENLEIIWKALHIFACKTYIWQSRFLITSRWCFQEFYKIRSGSVRTIFKLWNISSVQLIETESKPKACFARQIGFHLFNFVAGIFWQLLGRSRGLIERQYSSKSYNFWTELKHKMSMSTVLLVGAGLHFGVISLCYSSRSFGKNNNNNKSINNRKKWKKKKEKKKQTSQIAKKLFLNWQERIAIGSWLEALWKSQLNQFCLHKGTIATFVIYPSIYDVNSAGFRQHFNSEEGGVPLFASTSSTTQCSQ